jgi:hypothetical protein
MLFYIFRYYVVYCIIATLMLVLWVCPDPATKIPGFAPVYDMGQAGPWDAQKYYLNVCMSTWGRFSSYKILPSPGYVKTRL